MLDLCQLALSCCFSLVHWRQAGAWESCQLVHIWGLSKQGTRALGPSPPCSQWLWVWGPLGGAPASATLLTAPYHHLTCPCHGLLPVFSCALPAVGDGRLPGLYIKTLLDIVLAKKTICDRIPGQLSWDFPLSRNVEQDTEGTGCVGCGGVSPWYILRGAENKAGALGAT